MPKLLGEFLQEQQEPFVLHVYLLERGCCSHKSKTQDSPWRRRPRKRRPPIPNCAAFARGVFSRLVLHNHHKIKNNGIKREAEKEEDDDDEDEFSSASATTLYNSCSESEVGEAECITKPSSFTQQLHPLSVLEQTQCQGSPLHRKQYNLKSYKCKLKQPIHRAEHAHDQYSINKRALQQTKQLLVDCVREVIENQRKRDDGTGQQLKKILGAEELWKVVCENVWLWSQDSIDETNIVHMLNSDFMASLEEWSSASHQHKNETAMEIAEAILEDIVYEIVACH